MRPPRTLCETFEGELGNRPTAQVGTAPLLPLASVALVFAAFAFAFLKLGTLNVDGFLAVQSLTTTLPDTAWAMLTICGTGLVAFALISPSLLRQPRYFAGALASGILAGLYANVLKRLFALPRPASVLDATQVHVIGQTLHANAFPSGHAITAFTLASLLVFASRNRLRTALWSVPFALLVALSRIAVGAHWPADVALGAAGGWICGAAGIVFVRRWRPWNTVAGVRLFAVISIGVGFSLFRVDLGYPLAIPLQYLAGLLAVVSGTATLVRPRVDRDPIYCSRA